MRKKILVVILLIVCTMTVFSQGRQKAGLKLFSYENSWKKVDSLEGKGLTRSALEQVEIIYNYAKTENNAPNFVKALFHKSKYRLTLEENSYKLIISDFKKEITTSPEPLKSVLHSVLAEIYWRYYENNRFKFLNRSVTSQIISDDIDTWDLKKIVAEVISNYQKSISNKEILQNTHLNIFDEILTKGTNTSKLRATLFDFIAHRAVDFYINEEPGIIRPANKFEIDNKDYLLQGSDFTKLNISTTDTFSLKYYALNILKDLTIFHLNDKEPSALIDIELKRLEMVHNKGTFEDNDSLYINSLQTLENKYINYPASTEITLKLAEFYYKTGLGYDPETNPGRRWFISKANIIAEEAIKRFPDTDASKQCELLLNDIKKPYIDLKLEKAIMPDKPALALLTSKMIKNLFFRIIKINPEEEMFSTYDNKDLLKYYLDKQSVKEWSLNIGEAKEIELDNNAEKIIFKSPQSEDYQNHKTEIRIPSLKCGYYVLIASTGDKFDSENDRISFIDFYSSEISYINRQAENGIYNFYVFNRETGEPLKDVNAQLYFSKFNYNTRKNEFNKGYVFTSDKDGLITISSDKENNQNFYIKFSKEKDELFSNEQFYLFRDQNYKPSKRKVTYFFTDRAIYRPGQTIYYKGITLETDGETNNIVTDFKTKVKFYDVNRQLISETDVITNEYGSFSGSFIAPSGKLNGSMFITNELGYKYFSVEEYKRPKFEVGFNPIKEAYKTGETIKITGFAKAFSGSNITDAQVKFRVVRQVRYPFWSWWWRPIPSGNDIEITNGFTTTNEKGEFTISFKAIPDPGINKSINPIFNYKIIADVSDINGETRSGEQTVKTSYKELFLNVDIPSEVNISKTDSFGIIAENINGIQQKTNGVIKIFRLKQPDRILRNRKWDKPDMFLIKEDEFRKDFPNDCYYDENNMLKWAKESKVYEEPFYTESEKLSTFNFQLSTLKNGYYVLEISAKDKSGTEIKNNRYFTLFSDKEKQMPVNKIGWFTMLKSKCQPGEKASFLIGTSLKKVKVIYEIEQKDKIVSKEWIELNNEQKKIEIPVTEEQRGNFGVHFTFVKLNDCYHYDQTIEVDYSNKNLDIQFETFRNKLNPGDKEQWKLKIKGKDADKVAAEMVASLYDASLDVFRKNSWDFNIFHNYYPHMSWSENYFNTDNSTDFSPERSGYTFNNYNKIYDRLNWFGFDNFYGMRNQYTMYSMKTEASGAPNMKKMSVPTPQNKDKEPIPLSESPKEEIYPEVINTETDLSKVSIRKNFNETAFFYPALQTNENGEVIINFTVPESLTKWNFMGFAHTKDLKYGFAYNTMITQKNLMITTNTPRFFREGDKITISTKIANLSEGKLNGEAKLFLFDALTMKTIDEICFAKSSSTTQSFSVDKDGNTSVSWDLTIPSDLQAITCKIVAKSGNNSDGEEITIPVLTNKMLVTESMPLPIRGKQIKNFIFQKLLYSKSSNTIKSYNFSLEFTSNPVWYAIQALPYMMEYPYECSEQIFSRYYANSIASFIVNSNPKIKQVFDLWKSSGKESLLSNLEKNQELKSLFLEQTPWVFNAQSETESKNRVALLFDLNKMSYELDRAFSKLLQFQLPDGSWPWMLGMQSDRYITQHIVAGFGKLNKITNIKPETLYSIKKKAINYLDAEITKDYESLKSNKMDLKKNTLSNLQIQYLYTRSFYPEIEINKINKEAFDYYFNQAKKYWLNYNNYLKGMIAIALNRYNEKSVPADIIKSLRENAINNEELGMYWKEMSNSGYFWYQAPVETASLLIEAFDEVANDQKAVEDIKTWLLIQKQTQDWKTTKATADACYAILKKGTNLLVNDKLVDITVGGQKLSYDKKAEAGTGYFKTSYTASEIKPQMANITITKKDEGLAWGAAYWQYFEQLDKITPHETPLKITKKLFVEINTPEGPVIKPVNEQTPIKTGDKVKVRIEIRSDRDMEYIHMKDMRAAGFEPINVLSGYKYQNGLGYYESTTDVATNFFFNYLPKGTYVFEYPLRAFQKGYFSNGITTIQCFYAPEFTSHSEGIKLDIE
ncbi:MAG: alpha-2-macroglobulin family protein [Bacteroidota bacterium]|nr:alpha-2-macroglobulin family protein [Bacteroidota bacterium]